jgi:penicillin-binding protein 1C
MRRWFLLPAAAGVIGLYAVQLAGRAHLDALTPTPIVTDRHGVFLAQFGHAQDGRTEYGFWPVDPPARVVQATLALEDRRFWSHPGVDVRAIMRAVWEDVQPGRRRSGASTVAMQVARMQHPAARTLWTKAVEAGTALALTAHYGRAAVLSQYLRLVPYGNGSHGIAHAARWYFGKPAADLSWAEAALLAAIPQAPATHNPRHPDGLRLARARAARALDTLWRNGTLTDAVYAEARAQLAGLRPGPAPVRPPEAMHAILRLEALATGREQVTATLDLGLQRALAERLRVHFASWRDRGAQQAAVIVVRRDTHEVLAAVGSTGWASPHGGAIDFTQALRSPGSTLKPFIYAAALQRGLFQPAELLDDSPAVIGTIGNADGRYLGPMPAPQALANSRNVPAADLLRRLGVDRSLDLFADLGLHDRGLAADSFGLSMAIGGLPTRMDRLAAAYGSLADDGVLSDLVWYRGQPVAPPTRIFTVTAARQVAGFLSDPLARLPGFGRYGNLEYPFAVAVKTGTSQGYRDAWTVAWSERFLVAVWVGRADAGPMAGLGGVNSAALIVHDLLLALHGTLPGDLADAGLPSSPRRSAAPSPVAEEIQLSVAVPAANTHVWRNPEAPPVASRLILMARVVPHVRQVVWYVDGAPFAVSDPDERVAWPLTPGEHRFQIGLPMRPERSRAVRVEVD